MIEACREDGESEGGGNEAKWQDAALNNSRG